MVDDGSEFDQNANNSIYSILSFTRKAHSAQIIILDFVNANEKRQTFTKVRMSLILRFDIVAHVGNHGHSCHSSERLFVCSAQLTFAENF